MKRKDKFMKKIKDENSVTFSKKEVEEIFQINCHHFVMSNNINAKNMLIAFINKKDFLLFLENPEDRLSNDYKKALENKSLAYVLLIQQRGKEESFVEFFSKDVIGRIQMELEHASLAHPEFFEYNSTH
jgi:inorganic pyrophosphatase/exopolyphosphatase